MKAALILLGAAAASTCLTPPKPNPTPDPIPYPIPDGGDGGGTTPTPEPGPVEGSTCDVVLEHLRDLECPPAGDSAAWLVKCSSLSAAALSCVLATDTCAVARQCLEK